MADDNEVSEPGAAYEAIPPKKKIIFFNSFEEAEEYGLREMANRTYEERLAHLEVLRKHAYGHLPRGKRVLTIVYGTPRSDLNTLDKKQG